MTIEKSIYYDITNITGAQCTKKSEVGVGDPIPLEGRLEHR